MERGDDTTAFLKAFDYSFALKQQDAAAALQALTAAYLFERKVLERCADRRLSRVVLALDYGEIDVPGFEPLSKVSYLVFERAECDVRRYRDLSEQLDNTWALRALHNTATGLRQLHDLGVTHQDLKPSNVLVFDRDSSKIGDLGRAALQGEVAPHEDLLIAGDRTYAPPELLYGESVTNVTKRRRACDVYHLGSLASFFFTGIGTTAALARELHPSHQWRTWGGSYSEVLPYVRDAFDKAATSFEEHVPTEFSSSLSGIFRELCDPDPERRGDPKARTPYGNPYSLERYVSRFDLLARKAELALERSLR